MNANMDESEPLSYEDIGHLLDAKADKLTSGSQDPETVIREILETLARSENIRPRETSVDSVGRVSLGRDLTGTHGVVIYQPDSAMDGDGDD